MSMKKSDLIIVSLVICMLISSCGQDNKNEKSNMEPRIIDSEQLSYETTTVKKGEIVESHNSEGVIKSSEKEVLLCNIEGARVEKVHIAAQMDVKKGAVIISLYSRELDEKIAYQKMKVDTEQAEYDKAKSELRDDEIILNELNIEKEILAQLMEEKEGLEIKSSIDGRIKEIIRKVEGSKVEKDEILVVIENRDDIIIEGTVPKVDKYADDIDIYYPGMVANIVYEGHSYNGEVVQVNREYDQKTKTKRCVIVKFKDEVPDDFEINDKIEFSVEGISKKDILYVPVEVVGSYDGDYFVYVLRDGNRVRQYVKLGIINHEYVEIVSGVEEGEKIILK